MKVLEGLYYSKEHEWLRVSELGAYVGITDYAQDALGDIAYVEFPEVDEEFEADDVFGAVESVKAASDLFMPVSAKIIEVNEAVSDDPGLVNKDAFENWLVKIEMKDENELTDLLSAEEYGEFISKEA